MDPMVQTTIRPGTDAEFTLEQVEYLLSPAGQEGLRGLAHADLSEANRLRLVERLRGVHGPQGADALIRQALLRRRARTKFPRAETMYFTAQGLEQATAWAIARRRAAWLHAHLPPGPVLDLGCGIGGDLLALAHHRQVIAYEVDPVRLRFAQANVQALGLDHRVQFHQGDWRPDLANGRLAPAAAAFVDPSRRRRGRRVHGLARMDPPLSALLALRPRVRALAVKAAPGVQSWELPAQVGVTYISHEGVCKEALLAFPPLDRPGARRAWVHTGREWHVLEAAAGPAPPVGSLEPGMILHEPDPAVIRAGAFATLCRLLEAHLLDPDLAYLAGRRPALGTPAAPFVRSFQVEEVHRFHLKTLNRRLRALGVGRVELKKRGAPFAPESLRHRLRLVPGGRPAVVFFTRVGCRPTMILARRL